jgi:tetratricopeptide (TPR) repeat protein
MGGQRLVLVIGSQCQALHPVSFLPGGQGPVQLEGLRPEQRLVVELRDLLVDGPGRCAAVRVDGESAPGLLINPTKAVADAALITALSQAHAHEAVLVVHFLGHGTRYQADPALPARHLLHVWDTVAAPEDTEPEGNGWDPYRLVERRRAHAASMVGLVLLVDACYASWAKQQVDSWSGVRGGLLSAWLGASGDEQAWDGCFTKTFIKVLERGMGAAEHYRGLLVPELLVTDLEPVMAAHCQHQAPRLGGFEYHNPVLTVARNRQASELGASLGLDAASEALLLRLTSRYVTFAVDTVADAVAASRVVAVVGGAGTGKSTMAAALRHPPLGADDVPLALVQAVAFAAADSSVPGLARALRAQLDRLPSFPDAAARFERANATRWETLDLWQQQITGPLTHYPNPVRLLVDGLDQLDGQPAYPAVRRALTELTADALGHVKLVITSRATPALDGIDTVIMMPAIDDATGRRYLGRQDLDADTISRLVEVAAGNWLVLELAADAMTSTGLIPGSLPALYTDLLTHIRTRNGSADAVLAVLAAAGTGPVLPLDLLSAALAQLGYPLSRAAIHRLLGDPDLRRVLDRTEPGQVGERLGLFHQTLLDHLTAHPHPGSPLPPVVHGAIIDAIDELAPADRHTPVGYRTDPLFAYAFDAGPRHRWQAERLDELAYDLAARPDPVPQVNLTRWITWANRIRDSLGPDHPISLAADTKLAEACQNAGRTAEAIPLYERILADRERMLGPDHPDTLTSRNNLANGYRAAGRAAEAIPLLERTLADSERIQGPDHPHTLTSRGNLPLAYMDAGRTAEAIPLLERTLADCERILAPDDPDTLTSRNNLAGGYLAAGRAAEAIPLYERILADRERMLGPDHPDTLTSRNNLAGGYLAAGRAAEAIPLLERTVADCERILGPDHPDTLGSRNNLAGAYQNTGRIAEAIPLYERTGADLERILGPDHPDSLGSRTNLAGAYEDAGRIAEAIPLYERTGADLERILGPDHPDTLRCRNNLAGAYRDAGRTADAITLLERTVADCERILGPDHPNTLTSRNNLAGAYGAAGRTAEAIALLERTLADRERILGPDHSDTLDSHANLLMARLDAIRRVDLRLATSRQQRRSKGAAFGSALLKLLTWALPCDS